MDILDMIPDENGVQKVEPTKGYKTMVDIHGAVVAHRMEPYHDVTVYADGYEDWFYIGD